MADIEIKDAEIIEQAAPQLLKVVKKKNRSAEIVKLKLDHKELSEQQIATLTGTTQQNVHKTLKRYNIDTKQLTGFKKARADIMAGLQDTILSSIDPEILNKASLKDRIISASILYDKERLETGKSTQNIAMSKVVELIDKESSNKE